jgi:hypothetical protein
MPSALPIGRILFAVVLAVSAASCGPREPEPPITIIFDFAGDAILPPATLDSIAQAMAVVWHVRLGDAPQRVRVLIQDPPLSFTEPASIPALFAPCQGRPRCVERFALSLTGARLLRESLLARVSEPEWYAYIMAHEAVHLWQQARGDVLTGTRQGMEYAIDPLEQEAFREAALVAGARRIVLTGSDAGTVTVCPGGMDPRDCGYRPGRNNPYVEGLREVRYRMITE